MPLYGFFSQSQAIDGTCIYTTPDGREVEVTEVRRVSFSNLTEAVCLGEVLVCVRSKSALGEPAFQEPLPPITPAPLPTNFSETFARVLREYLSGLPETVDSPYHKPIWPDHADTITMPKGHAETENYKPFAIEKVGRMLDILPPSAADPARLSTKIIIDVQNDFAPAPSTSRHPLPVGSTRHGFFSTTAAKANGYLTYTTPDGRTVNVTLVSDTMGHGAQLDDMEYMGPVVWFKGESRKPNR